MESVTVGQDSRNILVQHSCYGIDSTAVACLQNVWLIISYAATVMLIFNATLLVQTTQMWNVEVLSLAAVGNAFATRQTILLLRTQLREMELQNQPYGSGRPYFRFVYYMGH